MNAENNDDDDSESSSSSSRVDPNQKRKVSDDDDTRKNEPSPVSIDEWLDRQFFDPTTVDETSLPVLRWFATLLEEDYELAETIYVGCFGFVLILIAQELVRAQMHH